MGLAEVLIQLSQLLQEPERNADAIYALLAANDGLAEYEVARFYAFDRMAQDLATRVRSIDPSVRRAAADLIPQLCPRSVAAKLLRPLVKDADIATRRRARHVVRELELRDVALRDPRFDPTRNYTIGPMTPGAYNPSGWAFGVYGRKPRGRLDAGALARHGLPSLEDRAAVATFLGCDDDAFSALLRPGTDPGSAYIEFEVPKATGGTRRIAAPRKTLRTAQRVILDEILSKVPVHRAAHGFVKARSTVTNAQAHTGRALVLKLDLVDFFPSIHYRRVVGLFETLGYPTEAAKALAGVCTYRPKLADGRMVWPGLLPQGAPTSPAITNLVCRRLDARLAALAKKAGGTYTRYADDMTFSFPSEPERIGRLFWFIDRDLRPGGLHREHEEAPRLPPLVPDARDRRGRERARRGAARRSSALPRHPRQREEERPRGRGARPRGLRGVPARLRRLRAHGPAGSGRAARARGGRGAVSWRLIPSSSPTS
ncbi:MAG: reverse transcriptase family protein [Minicystis sp.]